MQSSRKGYNITVQWQVEATSGVTLHRIIRV